MIKSPKTILRLSTAGSVDDGKSTLIGRLMYESKAILKDQLEAIKSASIGRGEEMNLAYLTDGLKAEREQGITIDVAYRYFSTEKRKYIIADTPGHVQYTRNMVTGASSSQVSIILIDARKGLIEQTKRHLVISTLLRIPHIAICINKMDLVGWNEDIFEAIKADVISFVKKLNIQDLSFIPVSALKGDNILTKSQNLDWYKGSTLMYYLENVFIEGDKNLIDFRFPVQLVVRVDDEKVADFRGYAGNVVSGTIKVGEEITALPSGFNATVSKVFYGNKEVNEASAGHAVLIQLKEELDISRGDMLVKTNNKPEIIQDIDALICWFDHPEQMIINKKYLLKQTTNESKCMITDLLYELDIETLHRKEHKDSLRLNEIGRIKLRTMKPMLFDSYAQNKGTGAFILIDTSSNRTVAAGMKL